jgi:outer membrane protein
MKKYFFAITGAIALTLAGATGVAMVNSAEAQSAQKAPVILVINSAQIVSQSKAGQTIPDQAKAVQASVVKELEAEVAKLKKDIENYQKNASLMSDEVRARTEKELQIRQQYALPQREKIVSQVFNQALQNAQSKILIASQPIMKDIIEKRGATIVLDTSQVMYAAVETDITQEVIAVLDKKMKTVEVQKISLTEIEKQLQEAAKAQAEAAKNKK